MSGQQHTHAMLLSLQLASIFKYVDDLGTHREKYNSFTTLESEHMDIVTMRYEEGLRKGRNYVDALVNSDRNSFRFRQKFNFGILLELEVSYLNSEGEFVSLLDAIKSESEDELYISELMIDFEYCISILTEYVASNLNLA